MATAPQLVTSLASLNHEVSAWVDEVARLTQPDKIYWCDGSESEFAMLERELVAKKALLPLNQDS
jgi:phosphoenolpyruvate carboxykinase (GTP)